MKKLRICTTIFFALLVCFYSNNLQAQFLKKIMNTVKNTAQNRANNQASQSTNNTIDKALSGTTSNTNNSSMQVGDSSSTNRVLGAFAQAAQQNPNDTSSADLTMKALGNLIGGGGVSATDSAAAIKSFMTAKGGSGVLYEYMTTITSTKMKNSKDTSTRYLTNTGYGRSEMSINMPGASSGKIITIGHAENAKYSVMLEPDAKTYSLIIIDTSLINDKNETYQVTKIGNENVGGYNCIHSKMTSSFNSRFLKSSTAFDIWTSTEVPGYSTYQKLVSMQNLKPAMLRALEQDGGGGFFVKMTSSDKDYSMEMLLIKAENKTFPASLFEIPNGYTESNENMMFHMMPGAKK